MLNKNPVTIMRFNVMPKLYVTHDGEMILTPFRKQVISDTIRIAPGFYEYFINRKTFLIERIGKFKNSHWNIHEVVGGAKQKPFDTAFSLKEAKAIVEKSFAF